MTTTAASGLGYLAAAWHHARSSHALWTQQVALYAVLFFVALMLAALDDRTLLGVSVWTKPAKFTLSILTYFATLALMASYVPDQFFRSLPGRVMTWMAVIPAALEIGYIYFMAALQLPSHYNYSTPLTALAYSLMGAGAVALVTVCVWLGIAIARFNPRWTQDPLLLSVVLGLVLTFLLGGGFGGYLGSQAGHWVGDVRSDAGGLPLLGWNTTGGDLRVAHFFGMHAMQVIPMIGLLTRHLRWGALAVLIAAAGYGSLATGTFLQALAGAPLF